ncbi:TPA: FAD-dependent monooxygenase [Pseudomonas aeruginosa]|nr:FAD-dependent monooxygenase [Pseudomonas aeruginosa]HBP6460033.1 FAD-dependent monooxygenase [Pseudomonas aeruginosa]
MDILIVGGGIGGLCLAHGLLNTGLSVRVFERQSSPSDSLAGYGIHLDPLGLQALKACLPSENWQQIESISTHAGAAVTFRDEYLDVLAVRDESMLSGKSVNEVELRGIGRLELRDILLNGLNRPDRTIVEWGKEYTHYENLPDGRLKIYFTDGTSAEGDLLVGADASNSKVRKQYLPGLKRIDLGILSIAGRYIIQEENKQELPRPLTDGSLNNIVPAGLGWMFVTSLRSRPANVAGEVQPMEDYVIWAFVGPQDRYPEGAKDLSGTLSLRDFVLDQIAEWSPDIKLMVSKSEVSTIAAVPLRSMPKLDPWQPSNVTLIGDAIHNMTPMAGAGANTALRDAQLLRDKLVEVITGRKQLITAIAEYEATMRHYANHVVGWSRKFAEGANSSSRLSRWFFRLLLRLANAYPAVMRATIGRSPKISDD